MTGNREAVQSEERAGRPAEPRNRQLVHRLQTVDWYPFLLLGLTNVAFGLRVLWLDRPRRALIFDETYYVNAARIILGLPVPEGAPYHGLPAGLDPNTQHPPGAKLLIAGSMRLFGDNAVGWRLPSVLFGTVAIALVYGIVRRAGGLKPMALLAAFVFAFDNLVFVHSRIATLDIFLVAFLLLGVYCYLGARPVLAGLAFVAATLCKIQGVYGIGAVAAFEAARLLAQRRGGKPFQARNLQPLVVAVVVYAVALPLLLGGLDRMWSTYKNPFDHIGHILKYGFSLARPEGPQGSESNPWQWLVNEVQMPYLRTNVQVLADGKVRTSRPTVFFRGAMNPYVIFVTPMAMAYAARTVWRRRDDVPSLTLVLFLVTFLPYWPAALLAHRISYIFYFLPVLPAVAMAAAHLMYARAVGRLVRWAYIGAVLLGFYAYFPFRQVPS